MSFNGSGTFVINTAGQPVVSGTVISSTAFNALTADLATGLSTCITKDGQTTPTANIPMGNNKITGLAVGTAATDAANLSQVQSTTAKLITASGTDTVTGTLSPTLTAYAAGQMFYWIAAGANTGAVTLNIDSLGAKAVTRDGSTALAAGDIRSGEVVVVVYDGTRFQVVSQVNSGGDATFANVSITSALNVGGVATFTGNPVLSGGTANGVLYLNGSKVATSGANLTYDGTTFTSVGQINVKNDLLLSDATATQGRAYGDASGVVWRAESGLAQRWHIGSNEQMRLNSTGLGIGTSSPGYKLDTNNTSAGTIARFVNGVGRGYVRMDGYDDMTLQFYRQGASVGFFQTDSSGTEFLAGTTGAYPFIFYTNNSEKMRLTSAGNLGLGVTPSAWTSPFVAQQIGSGIGSISLAGRTDSTADMFIGRNVYYGGSPADFRYIGTGTATRYRCDGATHAWSIAASGTAGNAISFTQAMTLDASGNLGVGTTSPDIFSNGFARNLGVAITGAGTTAAINVSGGAASRIQFGVGSTRYGLIYQDDTNFMQIGTTTSLPISFQTNSAERARITAAGNVGIGTTSPTDYGSGYLNLEVKGSSASGGVFTSKSASGDARFYVTDSAGYSGTWANIPHLFFTNSTERARITSGGDFWVGTATAISPGGLTANNVLSAGTSSQWAAAIRNSTATTPWGLAIQYSAAAPNDTSSTFLYCIDSGPTLRASIRSNGGLANYQSNNADLSDARTKKDITPAASMWDKIGALEIVTYKYNDQTHDDVNVGVIAQQVESVEPVWVDSDGWGGETPEDGVPLKTVYTKDITFAAIKALQEAMARIEQLEAKVAALETK